MGTQRLKKKSKYMLKLPSISYQKMKEKLSSQGTAVKCSDSHSFQAAFNSVEGGKKGSSEG